MSGLSAECRLLCSYLADLDAEPYVIERYEAAHRTGHLKLSAAGGFDRLLVGLGLLHPLACRAVDLYAALFRRRALLRKKLTLLIAILETRPALGGVLETMEPGAPGRVALRALLGAMPAIILAALLAVVLLPLQLAFGLASALRGGVAR